MSTQPFIRTREAILSDPYDPYVANTPSIQRKYIYQLWPLKRIFRYVDMLAEFGFNSLMLTDLAEDYCAMGYRLSEDQWGDKLHAICDYAAKKGLGRTLFIWGTGAVGPDSSKVDKNQLLNWTFFHPCPCVKGGNAALDWHYRRQARHAPHFDHFVSHWGDPGRLPRRQVHVPGHDGAAQPHARRLPQAERRHRFHLQPLVDAHARVRREMAGL